MGSEEFCLKWNDFETNISDAFRELRNDEDFFDVTLACNDEQIQAHKVILSACSPFFRNVLRRNPHQHPLLYLKGVKYTDIQSVMDFMYHGEVNVAQEELNSFLAVAEDLKVKGLTPNQSGSSSSRSKVPKARPNPPIIIQDDDIQEVVPVKTKPREHIPAAAPFEMNHNPICVVQEQVAPPPQPTRAVAPPQLSQQLQQFGGDSDDDSYDDYGQRGGDAGYDGTLFDQGMKVAEVADQEKKRGQDATIDVFQYIVKDPSYGPKALKCTICGYVEKMEGAQFCSSSNMKLHVEGVHFHDFFSFSCEFCGQLFNKKKSLYTHVARKHKGVKKPKNIQ